ncbi:MAG TPA: hypothetical protein VFH61_11765 [Thermoleophilia bacterium]|nr:hypothetical protein [Thermoleophilia bacterium]
METPKSRAAKVCDKVGAGHWSATTRLLVEKWIATEIREAVADEKKRTDDMQQCLDVVIEALPQDRLRALIESLDDDLT